MMRTMTGRSVRLAAILTALLPAALLVLAGCDWFKGGPDTSVDLAPFKKMAREGGCADTRNRLFLIDGKLVFWDRAGSCADAAYSQELYGSTPQEVLCVFHDSIAGPVRNCQDAAYQGLFDTITANLDKADLGLGTEHTVQAVRF